MHSLTTTSALQRIQPAVMPPLFRESAACAAQARVRIDGRLFRIGDADWYLKGLTYGPFRPNSAGEHIPEPHRAFADLANMRSLGCNAIRLYHLPTLALLDAALAHDIRVMIDVP